MKDKLQYPEFHKPPDEVLSLNTLLDFHFLNNPNYPFAVLARDYDQHPVTITWNEMGTSLMSVAQNLKNTLPRSLPAHHEEAPVVAIIASIDPLSYFTVLLGIMRAGCVPFPISPRNSPMAIEHLLRSTDCKHVYVQIDALHHQSNSFAAKKQIDELLKIFSTTSSNGCLHLHPIPSALELFPRLLNQETYKYNSNLIEQLSAFDSPPPAEHETLLILHSSGTTSFPKPIHFNSSSIKSWLTSPKYTKFSWTREIIAGMVLPVFHAMGFHFSLFNNLTEGSISGFFHPEMDVDGKEVHKVVSSIDVMKAMKILGCSIAGFSPMMLTEYASDPTSVEFLKTLKVVGFGGGPLSMEVGTKLYEAGVQLFTMYGSTEVGPISLHFPDHSLQENWSYFILSPQLTTRLIPHGDQIYELIILSSDRHRCSLKKLIKGLEHQEYSTHDLIQKHPRLNLYRVVGRLDDQIMLSNGEKTNPGPLEAIIQFDPAVRSAVMFGRGMPQNGILIEPEDGYGVDIRDGKALERYINQIWPSIQEANRFGPSHSRITRDFIIITDRQMPKTLKGAVDRVKALQSFSDEIEDIYTSSNCHKRLKEETRIELNSVSISYHVKEIVKSVLEHEVNESDDLFLQGCDSLGARDVRHQLVQLISQPTDLIIPQNIVYQHPSISKLSDWLLSILSDSVDQTFLNHDQALERLRQMILKYSPQQASKTFTVL